MGNTSLVYIQMPSDKDFRGLAVEILETMAKDKNITIQMSINRNGKWIIKNGSVVKSVEYNFVQAVKEFGKLAYPNIKVDD